MGNIRVQMPIEYRKPLSEPEKASLNLLHNKAVQRARFYVALREAEEEIQDDILKAAHVLRPKMMRSKLGLIDILECMEYSWKQYRTERVNDAFRNTTNPYNI